eukprot:TRINITY_DN17916_c0_g1_i1.p1 TRINITY_DN17916_c0_g1~~TRINITY_DN17916_c0_g1_i1.p1  ORF type:complete len:267 (+),score=60.67 TRINITY_DN17916_c0_g1_i1:69-869(+)
MQGSASSPQLRGPPVNDEEWFLRHNDRSRIKTDAGFGYYEANPLGKKHFNAGAVGDNHSRQLFQKMASQRTTRSDRSLLALRTDEDVRREMAKQYGKVMRAPPGVPAPPRPSMRPSPGQQLPPVAEAVAARARASGSAALPAASAAGGSRQGAASSLSAAPPPGPPRSRLSACAPLGVTAASATHASGLAGSALDGSAAAGAAGAAGGERASASASRLSAQAPVGYGFGAPPSALDEEGGSDLASAVHASQLSVSDFFSWRPRMIM